MRRVWVLWFDPGGTTGWAYCSVGVTSLLNGNLYERMRIDRHGEIKGPELGQADTMIDMANGAAQSALGIESFSLRKFTRGAELLAPVRIRAMYEYGLHARGEDRRVFFQSPSEAMTTLTDDRQRRYDLWIPGDDHMRVAVKHCYTFLLKAQQKRRLREIAWPWINWTEEVQA